MGGGDDEDGEGLLTVEVILYRTFSTQTTMVIGMAGPETKLFR